MKRQCQMMQRTCYLFIPPHESSLHSAFNLWERSYPRLKHLPGKNGQNEKSMRRNKSCKTKVREEGAAPRAQGHGLVEGRARRQSRGRPSCCSRPQRPARTPGLQRTRRSTEQTASRTSEPPVGSCLAPRSGFREQYDGGQGPTLGPPRAASSQDSGPGSARLLLWPPGTPPRSAQPSPPPPGSQGVQPAWSPWPRWWRTCSSRWLIWPLTPVLDLDCSSSLLALDVGSPLCFTAPSCRQAGSLPPRPTPTHRGTQRDPELLPVPAGTPRGAAETGRAVSTPHLGSSNLSPYAEEEGQGGGRTTSRGHRRGEGQRGHCARHRARPPAPTDRLSHAELSSARRATPGADLGTAGLALAPSTPASGPQPPRGGVPHSGGHPESPARPAPSRPPAVGAEAAGAARAPGRAQGRSPRPAH